MQEHNEDLDVEMQEINEDLDVEMQEEKRDEERSILTTFLTSLCPCTPLNTVALQLRTYNGNCPICLKGGGVWVELWPCGHICHAACTKDRCNLCQKSVWTIGELKSLSMIVKTLMV
jgi:hypothetical protein